MELLMKFLLGIGHYVCKLIYYLLLFPAKWFSYFERLLIREDKRDRLQIGYLDEYLTDELTTQVQDKKREKERRENIEKLVKDLEEFNKTAVGKIEDKMYEFHIAHRKEFNYNVNDTTYCKIFCVQLGIDYKTNFYRNFMNRKNGKIKKCNEKCKITSHK